MRYADLLLQEDRRVDYPKSVPGIGLVNGKFVDENSASGTPGSLIPSTWGNSLTEELLNVIEAGGLEPSEGARDQVLEAIRALIEKRVNEASALPIGSMVPFPKGVVPPGFLEADGSVQSIATYPDLAAYIGTTFNAGDEGVGNFRLPDSRGEFLRGWDHGRGVDAGRAIGTWQKCTLVAADAGASNAVCNLRLPVNGQTVAQLQRMAGQDPYVTSDYSGAVINAAAVASSVNAPGNDEWFAGVSRPRNLAVMWCIKTWSSSISEGVIDIAALALEVQKLRPMVSGMQVYGTPGIFDFIVPSDTKADSVFEVQVWGAGGGGAGGSSGASGGGGGGGGGYSFKRLKGLVPGATIKVTVGAAGILGPYGGNGGAGGSSTFDLYCSATGGGGGKYVAGAAPGVSGGFGVGGDLNFSGDCGEACESTVAGNGGMASNGGGGGLGGFASIGLPGSLPGGGGGGGDGTFAGGAGASGMVVVKWR